MTIAQDVLMGPEQDLTRLAESPGFLDCRGRFHAWTDEDRGDREERA